MDMLLLFVLWCVVTFSHEYQTTSTYTFLGEESFATFETLNISVSGEISFRFKTKEDDGILLYVDDINKKRGYGNYMVVVLKNGGIVLKQQISYQEKDESTVTKPLSVSLGNDLNDGYYHSVHIRRKGLETILIVDTENIVVLTSTINQPINSAVHIGGVSPAHGKIYYWMSTDRSSSPPSLVGCISNLRYFSDNTPVTSERRKLIVRDEKRTKTGCHDACEDVGEMACKHSGSCLNMYNTVQCDCRGTGFTGKICQQPSKSISLFGEHVLVWKPTEVMNTYITEVMVRFQSGKSSGVIFYVEGEEGDDYIMLELFQRRLVFTVNIKGNQKQTAQFDGQKLNSTEWQFVKVLKNGQKVTLSLNDGIGERQYSFTLDKLSNSFHVKSVWLGGIDNSEKNLHKTKSNANFTGCLQDAVVNQRDLIASTFMKDSPVRRIGNPTNQQQDECTVDMDTKDWNQQFPWQPSLYTVEQSQPVATRENNDKTTNNKKYDNGGISSEVTKEDHDSKTIMWIIACSVVGLMLFILTIFVITRHILQKRSERHRQYSQHYLRQTAMAALDEDLLPTEQKCIREEIAKRKLQTFSPLRREFYVSASDHGSVARSVKESLHHGHSVLEHHHPCINSDYTVTACHQKQQQSPHSTHYAVSSRKCSHAGQQQYQTPRRKADSIKSFGSSQ